MKKLLSVILTLTTTAAVISGCFYVSSLCRIHGQKVELARKQAFNEGYTDHILAANESDDIYIIRNEINTAMDYLFTLRFDLLRASKADKENIISWYTERLATRAFLRDALKRGGLSSGYTWILKDVVLETFMSDGKVETPEDIWLRTIQTSDRSSEVILGALAPDIPEEFFNID